jgi:hypothetical protein
MTTDGDGEELSRLSRWNAFDKLTEAGYTLTEAEQILRYVREDAEVPLSRKKANRTEAAKAALREVGAPPECIDW